jgi:hypothetical protein
MATVVALSGGGGFLASYVMLHAGLRNMAVRYPLAVLAAWGVFLFLMWSWAQLERQFFLPESELEKLLPLPDPGESRGVSGWPSLLDAPDLSGVNFDLEGCAALIVMIVLLAAIAGALFGIISIVVSAPALIAEVFLDAALSAALYRRINGIESRWWLGGAAAQTFKPVAWTVLIMIALGLTFRHLAPGASSIGGVWLHYHPLPLEKM